jgi:phosphohistidine phosphatase
VSKGTVVELYLIRHADALALGERGITDDVERPLSEQGQNQMEVVARGLRGKGIVLDLIVSSPLVRARQTADLLVRGWSPAPLEVQISETLAPEAKPRKTARYLRDLKVARVGLVGHSPQLPRLAAWLIGGKRAHLDLAKAGVASITCDDEPAKGTGNLEWMVGPEWFVIS